LLLSCRCNGMAKQHFVTFVTLLLIAALLGYWNNYRFLLLFLCMCQ